VLQSEKNIWRVELPKTAAARPSQNPKPRKK
jgi:hypothetical protein